MQKTIKLEHSKSHPPTNGKIKQEPQLFENLFSIKQKADRPSEPTVKVENQKSLDNGSLTIVNQENIKLENIEKEVDSKVFYKNRINL